LADYLANRASPNVYVGRPRDARVKVAFLYTGMGSVYFGMARGLYAAHEGFRHSLQQCDRLLTARWGRSLLALMFEGDADTSELQHTRYVQAALFSVQVALTDFWRALGFEPSVVLGHSVGEYAAAYAAGVLSLEAGLALTAERGRLIEAHALPGGMISVAAGATELRELLAGFRGRLEIAAVNGERHVVLAGEPAALAEAAEQLRRAQINTLPLQVEQGFHSQCMEPVLEHFERFAAQYSYRAPTLRFVSGLHGGELTSAPDASYWARHVRETVRFADGVHALQLGADACVIEVGPKPTLSALASKLLGKERATCVPSLVPGRDDWTQLLGSLAQLYAAGANVRWAGLEGTSHAQRIALPSYPFANERHWFQQPDPARELRTEPPRLHPLAGSEQAGEGGSVFSSTLSCARLPWLADHCIRGQVVVPGALWLELVIGAVVRSRGARSLQLRDVTFRRALVLDEPGNDIQLRLEPTGAREARFEVHSSPVGHGDWVCHATGQVTWDEPWPMSDHAATTSALQPWDGLDARLHEHGIELGASFRWLREVRRGLGAADAGLRDAAPGEAGEYVFHPGLLDSCLQLTAATLDADAGGDDARVPFHIERLTLHSTSLSPARCRAQLRRADDNGDAFDTDVTLLAGDDHVIAELHGVSLRRIAKSALAPRAQHAFELEWSECAFVAEERADPELPWLLVGDEAGVATRLCDALVTRGQPCVHGEPDELAQRRFGAVVVLSALDPMLEAREVPARAQAICARLAEIARSLIAQAVRETPLWVITRGAVNTSSVPAVLAPAQAAAWGLVRVLASEHPELSPRLLDLDPADDRQLDACAEVMLRADDESQLALRRGRRLGARLRRVPAARERSAAARRENVRWTSRERGDLARMTQQREELEAPVRDELLIEVDAAGVNFRDVLDALGMYPQPGPFGGEAVGRIVEVGPDVQEFAVGQRVVAMFPERGALASYTVTRASFAALAPANLSDGEAAGVGATFLTARYALEQVAQLRPGERVLIHAAAGGVGLAAVQLALRAGAEVYATASSEKWAYLRSIGVSRVGSSRSTDFVRQLGLGAQECQVDVVVNSLVGELVDESLRMLRPGGRFVELGKRDLRSAAQVAELRADVTYCAFDLLEVARARPDEFARMLRSLMDDMASGALRPLPTQVFAFEQAPAAFRALAHARHLGKVVVQRDAAAVPGLTRDGAYLVTGGLGALGRSLALWLAERGAAHVVAVARNVDVEHESLRQQLAQRSCQLHVRQVDVGVRAELASLLAEFGESLPALRGVIHAAGALADAPLVRLSQQDFASVLAPKLAGAWHLHELTRELPLEFMLLVSSASALLGTPNQAAYAAANAFLDTLAHHRRALGLHACTLSYGPLKQLGMNRGAGDRWSALGVRELPVAEALSALDGALAATRAHQIVLPIDPVRFVAQARELGLRTRLFELLVTPDSVQRPAQPAPAFLEELLVAPRSVWGGLLERYLAEQVSAVLGLREPSLFDARRGFLDQGLDSLMGLELRNRLQTGLRCSLPTSVVLDHPTIQGLAEHLQRMLLARADGAKRAQEATPAQPTARALVPEHDLRRLIDAELALLANLNLTPNTSNHG
jgi:acyl transferase domain-containing protein